MNLFFEKASIWQDAVPLGNGTMGAMVFGNEGEETLLLNHENLWLPVKEKRPLKDCSPFLAKALSMAAENRYDEIGHFWYNCARVYDEDLFWPNPFMPGCELHITIKENNGPIRLNLEQGVCSTGECRYFVSKAHQVIVASIPACAFGGIRLSPVDTGEKTAWDGTPISALVQFNSFRKDEFYILEGRYTKSRVYGTGYGAIATVKTQGDQVFVFARIYDPCEWAGGVDTLLDGFHQLPDFSLIEALHRRDFSAMFCRSRIQLEDKDFVEEQIPAMLNRMRETGRLSPKSVEYMHGYGRYLLISSSGKLPANLQGLWNGDYNPPWQCDYTMDENIEMNYWQALPGNLPELTEAYFSLFEQQRPQWRENAKKLFGCRGVLAPIKSTVDALSCHISPEWCWSFWTAGAGWIASLYFDYYRFSLDKNFLKNRVYPLLREIYEFYTDYLQPQSDGSMGFPISISPENTPLGGTTMLAPNATMEIAVAREVLTELLECGKVLSLPKAETEDYQSLLSRLPKYCSNSDGALKEWLHPSFADNYKHRHQSHLYPLFPGFEAKGDPKLFDACQKAVEKRLTIGLDSQTGWSLVHMANIFARLGQRDYAWRCLKLEIMGMVGPNLFTYHNKFENGLPSERQGWFQIDANLGFTAALQEMLLYSEYGLIELLPCLPKELPVGSAENLLCRGNRSVSFKWDKTHVSLRIYSPRDESLTLRVIPCRYEEALELKADIPFELTIRREN